MKSVLRPFREGFGRREKPTLLLLHGAGLSREMWQPQIETLTEEYRVIAPDLPGHGERADEPFTIERAVEVAANALAGENAVIVVGHSLGGYVGIALADQRPACVEGLVLSGASVDYRGIAGVLSWPQAVFFELRGRIGRGDNDGASLSAYGRSVRALCFRDFRTPLLGFDGKVLLLNGEEDTPNRAFDIDLAESLPNGKLIVIKGAGHNTNFERPDVFTDCLREFVGTHREYRRKS